MKRGDLRTCPRCGRGTTIVRYGSHPTATRLRDLAAWSILFGFAASLALLLTGRGPCGGLMGFSMFAFALSPAATLVVVSMFFPKGWSLVCPRCRSAFFKRTADSRPAVA